MAAAGFVGCGRTGQLDDLRVEAHVLGVPDGQQAQRERIQMDEELEAAPDGDTKEERRARQAQRRSQLLDQRAAQARTRRRVSLYAVVCPNAVGTTWRFHSRTRSPPTSPCGTSCCLLRV